MSNIVIPDGGNIGSASDPDAISISSTGKVTTADSELNVKTTSHTFTVKGIDSAISDSQSGTAPDTTDSDSGQFAVYNGATKLFGISEHGYVLKPNLPAFQAAMNQSGYIPSNGSEIEFSLIKFNNGNHYNNSNYRFTAPIAGIYFFHYTLLWRANSSPGYAEATLLVNGSKPNSNSRGLTYQDDSDTDAHDPMSVSYIVSLNAGDYVSVQNVNLSGNSDYYGGNGLSTFCGYLLA